MMGSSKGNPLRTSKGIRGPHRFSEVREATVEQSGRKQMLMAVLVERKDSAFS